MGTFRITVEIGDQSARRFQEVEALVGTGSTFTKVPRSVLEALDIPAARTYTALLPDGRRVPRKQRWATIRLEGQEFPTPVAFGEDGEPVLLGDTALEHALLAVDTHSRRLVPVDGLEMTSTPRNSEQPRRRGADSPSHPGGGRRISRRLILQSQIC